MYHESTQADRQYRILCQQWSRLSDAQKADITRLATGRDPNKYAIIGVASASLSAIAFLIFHNSLGYMLSGSIGVLAFFYGILLGGFLYDYIINIRR